MNILEEYYKCDGSDTCQKDCKCKGYHHPYLIDGQYCCDMYRGSCWHNDHNVFHNLK